MDENIIEEDKVIEDVTDNKDFGFIDELQIPQHISKVHNKWLSSELVSEDYIFAKLQPHEKEFIVSDITMQCKLEV
jgi:hypothetical protein